MPNGPSSLSAGCRAHGNSGGSPPQGRALRGHDVRSLGEVEGGSSFETQRARRDRRVSITRFGQACRAKPAPAGFPNLAVGSAARGTDPLEESLCHPPPWTVGGKHPFPRDLRIHIGIHPQPQPKPSAALCGICGQPKRLPHPPPRPSVPSASSVVSPPFLVRIPS